MARNKLWIGIALAALVCVSCFSPWTGEEGETGSVTVSIHAARNRAAISWGPGDEYLGEIVHTITLTLLDTNNNFAEISSTDYPITKGDLHPVIPGVAPGSYSIEVRGTLFEKPYSYYVTPTPVTTPIVVEAGITTQVGNLQMSMDPTFTDYLGYTPITSAEDLRTLATQSDPANFPLDGDYLVTADNIDLSAYNWTPIGTGDGVLAELWFTGTFDGNGKTIRGLRIDIPVGNVPFQGLFGSIQGGTVKNLTLAGVTINAPDTQLVGGIAGVLGFGGFGGGGEISNCIVEGGTIISQGIVGGVVGEAVDATISRCRSSVAVSGVNSGSGVMIGGVVGNNANTTIEYCSSTGDVEGIGSVGGVAGDNGGTVSYCFATGNVTGDSYVGGVTGFNFNAGAVVRDSYYTAGTVTGSASVGGVVGVNGGVVEKCYASGLVALIPSVVVPPTPSDYIGGVVGYNDSNGSGGSGLGVSFCVALNSSITMSPSPVPNFGRVVGINDGTGTSGYNYADMAMTTSGIPNADDGASKTTAEYHAVNFWTGTDPALDELGWDDTVWDFSGLASGGLPTLKPPAP